MSGDGEQEYFCDGLVDDILTSLSKLGGLRVIARNSSFVFKGRSIDVRDAAKQLGVCYVLEGSVRKSANRIRITAQLIDARDGAHLWVNATTAAVEDIFAIQDEITLVLATEMQIKLTEGEQALLGYTTTTKRPRRGRFGCRACPTTVTLSRRRSLARRGIVRKRRWRSTPARRRSGGQAPGLGSLSGTPDFAGWDDRDHRRRQG